jgi:hypothetical protein
MEANLAATQGEYGGLRDQYRTGMERARTDFEGRYGSMIDQYRAGMDEVYREAATGRENMLASVDQATAENVARQQAANAFSGLGLTSFGQGVVAARQSEGARQRGVIQEQYASQLAAIRQAQTQGVTSLGQAQAAGISEILQRMSQGDISLGEAQAQAAMALRGQMAQGDVSLAQSQTSAEAALRERMAQGDMTLGQMQVQGLSDYQSQIASGSTALAQAQASGLSDLRQRMSTGLAEMGTSYSGALANLQQGLSSQRLGIMGNQLGMQMAYREQAVGVPLSLRQAAITGAFQPQMNVASLSGAGSMQFGNALMGAGMGMVGNYFSGL